MRLSGCLPAQTPGKWWLIFKRNLWSLSQVVTMITLALAPELHNRIKKLTPMTLALNLDAKVSLAFPDFAPILNYN